MTGTAATANPYASFLGTRDPLEVLHGTADHLARTIGDLASPRLVRQPAPGKWSVRDILCHLADTEIAFGFRLRQTIAEANHVIQPFDQDAWASTFSNFAAADALAAFAATRRWNLLFIEAVGPKAYSKPVTHPERGPMTFRTIVETMAGHDVNHVGQVERLGASG